MLGIKRSKHDQFIREILFYENKKSCLEQTTQTRFLKEKEFVISLGYPLAE